MPEAREDRGEEVDQGLIIARRLDAKSLQRLLEIVQDQE